MDHPPNFRGVGYGTQSVQESTGIFKMKITLHFQLKRRTQIVTKKARIYSRNKAKQVNERLSTQLTKLSFAFYLILERQKQVLDRLVLRLSAYVCLVNFILFLCSYSQL